MVTPDQATLTNARGLANLWLLARTVCLAKAGEPGAHAGRARKIGALPAEMLACDLEADAAEALGCLERGFIAVVVAEHDWTAALEGRQLHEPGEARPLRMGLGDYVQHLAAGAQGKGLPGCDDAPQVLVEGRAGMRRIPVMGGEGGTFLINL